MNVNFTPNRLNISVALADLIDAGLEAERDKQTPRNYLGGSRLGEECDRRLCFEFQRYPTERPFDGQTLRRFNRGHDCETRMAAYIRGAGYELLTEKADGKQFGFYVAKGEDGVARIAGHLDGILMSGPVITPEMLAERPHLAQLSALKFPALWENKGLASKGCKKLEKDGLRKTYPIYYAQMQTYMAYLELTENPALFTALNSDDCTLYCELVPFDLQAAQAASDRGSRVVSAASPYDLPRITRDESDFRCMWCDHKAKCWAETPMAAPGAIAATIAASPIVAAPDAPATPSWLLAKP